MTILEGAVLLLLLLLALPDFCRRLERPGLLYPLYILAGLAAGAFMGPEVRAVWREIGQFGFVLLLFSVGLEIELPQRRETLDAGRRAALWMAWQLPALTALGWLAGVPWPHALIAAIALASTSVGMAYPLWLNHRFPDSVTRRRFLEWIVAVEVLGILLLAVAGPVLGGAVWWKVTLKMFGLLTAAVLAALIAVRSGPRIAQLLSSGLKIQVHFVVLVLFAIAAVGDRLGLSAPKTAFVLGLFVSRATDQEAQLSHRLEPLRDRLFVPVFFFGLGTLVEPRLMLTLVFPLAVGTGLLQFALRRVAFRWFFAHRLGTTPAAHVLAGPMLTIAAVAVEILARAGASQQALAWTLASSLSLTLAAALFRSGTDASLAEIEPTMAAPQAWELADRPSGPDHAEQLRNIKVVSNS
ncbi:MAG: cation:proton antiporter [Opitutaceae bacterium]|nr:cation:proton antiporter [Opitutaceae bacterium]